MESLCFFDSRKTCGREAKNSAALSKWLLVLLWVSSGNFNGAEANFNLYLDRREFQKLHGISSDIYYVREGVVNEYATSFLVTVPAEVDDLNFSWQALNKRPVYYEMVIDYTDFFALSPPFSNITNSGRVPQNLETFRVTLPCSGRSNAEVSVTIRMNFQVKHPKPNTTTINIKRNKICLLKEMTQKPPPPELPAYPAVAVDTNSNSNQNRHFPMTNTTQFFQDPTPSLLLAGLLGGCAVTASAVFLTFFICLRRKLTPASRLQHRSSLVPYDGSEPNSSSNNSSPACLLRQAHAAVPTTASTDESQMWKHFTPDKCQGNTGLSGTGSHNSYVTIASFWNDIFSTGNTNPSSYRAPKAQSALFKNPNLSSTQSTSTTRGSDVSPYAYAHIVPVHSVPPPLPKTGAPPLIEWYSQFPCQSSLSTHNSETTGHIYSNSLHTFSPKPTKFSHQLTQQPGEIENTATGHRTSTLKSTTDSLVQIDGFQCRKNLAKESNVVERFL